MTEDESEDQGKRTPMVSGQTCAVKKVEEKLDIAGYADVTMNVRIHWDKLRNQQIRGNTKGGNRIHGLENEGEIVKACDVNRGGGG